MSWIDGLKHRLRALIAPERHARDIADEMEAHLELARLQDGDSRNTALSLGNFTYYREEVRRMTWIRFVDVLRQDAGFAWRSITRNRGFTAMIVITLALGIGVNSAAFTVLDLIFLRPPSGVANPSELRRLYVEHINSRESFIAENMSYLRVRTMAAATGDTSRVAFFTATYGLRLGGHPRDPLVRGVYVSANYFDVLGVRTAMGRVFYPEEVRFGEENRSAVVSHRFWRTTLGGDSAAIGRTIKLGVKPYRVIGVLDPGFSGIDLQAYDVWIPVSNIAANAFGRGKWWEEENNNSFRAFFRTDGRIPDIDIASRATLEFREQARRSVNDKRDTLMRGMVAPIIGARGPSEPEVEEVISSRLSMVAALVLLIAFANVVNLLLARAVRRRHEFAIRLSLGISRGRLLRLLTTESVLLALIAMIPAAAAAWWGGEFLRKLLMPDVDWFAPAMSMRVLLFTAAITLISGVVAGLIPALQSGDMQLSNALKGSSSKGQRHRSRLRNSLLISQAAFSVVLLVGAVLFVRSLRNVQSVDIGFDYNRTVLGRLAFASGESPPRPVINAKLEEIAAQLESRPSVEAVAIAAVEPMRGNTVLKAAVNGDTAGFFTSLSAVSPDFFRAIGMQLLQGTTFTPGEGLQLVVNQRFAQRAWPGENPLGKCVSLGGPAGCSLTVVGVVEDATEWELLEEARPIQAYQLFSVNNEMGRTPGIIVRTKGDAKATIAELRHAMTTAFPAAEPTVRLMKSDLEPHFRKWQLGALLFSALGVLALIVALVGIYSSVTYMVVQRTHEFGVRIAHGAVLRDLIRQVVGESLRIILAGVLVASRLRSRLRDSWNRYCMASAHMMCLRQ